MSTSAIDIDAELARIRRERIEREGRAAANGHGAGPPIKQTDYDRSRDGAAARVVIECMADVTPVPVRWLWAGRLAAGKLTLIAGEAGAGKSTAVLDIGARITTGMEWPDGGRAPRGDVVILSAEDGVSDTIAPRLMAAGADRVRVHVVRAVTTAEGARRTFDLAADLAALDTAAKQIDGGVSLVIIDPITSYMGRIDSHRTTDVRRVLEPLAEYAERTGIAVIAISHPPKSTPAKALHAVTGSYAYVAAARIVLLVATDLEDDTRRLLLPVKNNLAAPSPGLAFRLEQRIVTDGVLGSHVLWDAEPVTITADQVMAAARDEGRASAPSAADECAVWLAELLADGPRTVVEIEREARDAGLLGPQEPIAQAKPFRRARRTLAITPHQPPGARHPGWVWALPRGGQMPSVRSDALPDERASDVSDGV